jgi:sensor histidine kinase YesM
LDNKYRLIHHILFISLIFLFWYLFTVISSRPTESYYKTALYSSTYVGVAYLNIYVLFSRLLLRGKLAKYVLVSLLTFVTSYVIQNLIYFRDWEQFRKDFTFSAQLVADMMINAITYYMFIGIGLSGKMIKKWLTSERRIMSLEQESLKSKLSNLKSQVSPHFFFNTFNNLYVLTKTNPAVASEVVLGFSDLMRYQLIECEEEKVPLEKEIGYIENFLALEKLRKDSIDIRVDYDKNLVKGIRIEPLLIVTLVENAVKHGSQQMQDPFIHITITRRFEDFTFEVRNSKPEVSQLGKERSLGKGLENLRRRLELLYPGSHTLMLTNDKNEFHAKLQLILP